MKLILRAQLVPQSAHRLVAALVLASLPAVGAPTAVAAPTAVGAERERTGPDSFLQWRANTVETLVEQVQNDSVLRQRLAKHFHVSQAELVSYLRDNLRVITFSSSGWRPVYGVTRSGRIYRSRDYFRKGGKVFGLADGTPVLKYACANPLTTELPAVAKKVAEVPPALIPPSHAPEEYEQVMGLPVTPTIEIPTARPFTTPEECILVAAVPYAPAFEVPLAAPVEAGGAQFPVWALAPGALVFWGKDGGQPVIPEPGELALFGGGLAMLGGLALWRRRRERSCAAV